jgi:hypothetical protein
MPRPLPRSTSSIVILPTAARSRKSAARADELAVQDDYNGAVRRISEAVSQLAKHGASRPTTLTS